MLPFVLLLLPLFVLAAPSPQGQLDIRSKPIKPSWAGTFTPAKNAEMEGQKGAFNEVGVDNQNQATCDHCFNLQQDVFHRNGSWHLDEHTNLGPDDWYYLQSHGNCALLVKNKEPTQFGNLIPSTYMFWATWKGGCDNANTNNVEKKDYIFDPAGIRIDFWVRSTAGLDLSIINP
ncbi:hypothetical protein F4806DRAFT_201718 [Annulohypoxylon nitens]|nr:hypothetical protein F4806DRAFT_201718 [Annulohypoxylon nitens]